MNSIEISIGVQGSMDSQSYYTRVIIGETGDPFENSRMVQEDIHSD